jgi:ankyrin repeat protein
MTIRLSRSLLTLSLAAWLLLACTEGATMRALDSSRYFSDPRVAAMVDDVQRGDAGRVRQALAAGVSANAPGTQGFRPIHFVFVAKDAEVLKVLLAAGADPMARLENSNTPLHFAVRMPNPDFTRVLLGAKADPNARGDNGKPVVHEALSSHEPENLRLLSTARADINVVWGGGTPLMSAVTVYLWDMATSLLDLGADASFANRTGLRAVDRFCKTASQVPADAENRRGILRLVDAFQRRGVAMPCEATIQKFR